MASDLNTHWAIAAMTDMAKSVGEMAAGGRLGAGEAAAILSELDRMMRVVGLRVARPPSGAAIDDRVDERRRMRLAGQYADADAVREELRGESVELLDYSGRTVWVYRERIPGEDAPDQA